MKGYRILILALMLILGLLWFAQSLEGRYAKKLPARTTTFSLVQEKAKADLLKQLTPHK